MMCFLILAWNLLIIFFILFYRIILLKTITVSKKFFHFILIYLFFIKIIFFLIQLISELFFHILLKAIGLTRINNFAILLNLSLLFLHYFIIFVYFWWKSKYLRRLFFEDGIFLPHYIYLRLLLLTGSILCSIWIILSILLKILFFI